MLQLTPWEQARQERVARRSADFEARHQLWHAKRGLGIPSIICTVCDKRSREAQAA